DHKSISTMICHRVLYHISEGKRDSTAIRQASTSIFEEHEGRVKANLTLLSVDSQSNTIVISRNTPVPVFLVTDENVDCLSTDSEPIGTKMEITPSIVELPIKPGAAVIAFSDGVYQAGREDVRNPDICVTIEALFEEQEPTAQEVADYLLSRAMRLDEGRPKDDMSIIVMLISPESTDNIRRMTVSIALDE
ncbi:MAG: SpoIIE family protein phosphatase, partial [Chloroflexota bacterium]|nr:SpoIIE family protein phosphatase [Chloroflexota bacterium]